LLLDELGRELLEAFTLELLLLAGVLLAFSLATLEALLLGVLLVLSLATLEPLLFAGVLLELPFATLPLFTGVLVSLLPAILGLSVLTLL